MDKKTIFLAALEIDSLERREKYLAQVCGSDEMQRQVKALLRAHGCADDFLNQPPLQVAQASTLVRSANAKENPVPLEHTHPGMRYSVLRSHAKGGLGEVFIAEDRELRREVALKEIREERATDNDSRARFVREAEITGRLEHPGIVPVYGLNHYEDGRPFYAMRLIQGQTLEEAICCYHDTTKDRDKGEGASFRQLLSRFVAVCQAVAYAHSRGVLHRDLKPSNIMLGHYGETLVVDWGLAKSIDQPNTAVVGHEDSTTAHPRPNQTDVTQIGTIIGTPAYMSPEQAAGKANQIGPASDIYNLGATLYVLLTGQESVKGDTFEILQQVQRGHFLSPRQIQSRVPSALEAVCLKAMSLSPDDRYQTPTQMAQDLENWLADEPVSAWQEPIRMRLGRWLRKHQRFVGAAATLILVVLLGSFVSALWYQTARVERQTRQRQLTNEITTALDQVEGEQKELAESLKDPLRVHALMNDLDGWKRRIDRAISIAEKARARAKGEEDLLDPALQERMTVLRRQLTEQEQSWHFAHRFDQIRLNATTARSNGAIQLERAGLAYHRFLQETLSIHIYDDESPIIVRAIHKSPIRYVLVAALDHWIMSTHSLGSSDQNLRSKLCQIAREADPDPWRDRVRQVDGWAKTQRATQLVQEVDVAKQSPHILAALSFRGPIKIKKRLLRRALIAYPGDFWLNFRMSQVCKEAAERIGYLQAALAVRPNAVPIYSNLGFALSNLGLLDEAIAAYQRALDLDPGFVIAHDNMGLVLLRQKRFTKAAEAFRKAIEADPQFVKAYNNLGLALIQLDQASEAIDVLHKAIKIDPKFANSHGSLGIALMQEKRFAEAEKALRQCLALTPKGHPKNNLTRQLLKRCVAHKASGPGRPQP